MNEADPKPVSAVNSASTEEINRWDYAWIGSDFQGMQINESGRYVVFADHEAALRKERERAELAEKKLALIELAADRGLLACIEGEMKLESLLSRARADALEEAAQVAENAFMNSVVPRHTSVRDFIAAAIRAKALEGKGIK